MQLTVNYRSTAVLYKVSSSTLPCAHLQYSGLHVEYLQHELGEPTMLCLKKNLL